MKYLSLRIQIFMLVALAVLTVGVSSFRSTWVFLSQDKLTSVRELQTLTLLNSLQELRNESQELREELRNLAVALYRDPQQLGQTFHNTRSTRGIYTWTQIRLHKTSDHVSLVPSGTSPLSHTAQLSASLLLDTPNVNASSNHQGRIPASVEPKHPVNNKKPEWKFQIINQSNQLMLQIEDPIKIGAEEFLLTGQAPASILSQVVTKHRFESIDVEVFAQIPNNRSLASVINAKAIEDVYKSAIENELSSSDSREEGRSIGVENNNDQGYISFGQLKLNEGKSNIILAFISEESRLVKEFQAFIAEQAFLLLSILMGALIAGFLVTRFITRPVSKLVDATKELEKGNFKERVIVETHNEIGRLAKAFNNLGQTLQEREDALAHAEHNMRQLSFQTKTFQRLTEFSENLSKIFDLEELKAQVSKSWLQLLNLPSESNFVGFYELSDDGHTLVQHAQLQNTNLPKTLKFQNLKKDIDSNNNGYEILNSSSLEELSQNVSECIFYQLPIKGEHKIHGLLVFTANEIHDIQKFNLLLVECQRFIVSSFEAADRYTQLKETSIRDGLTGLFNVRHFKEFLEEEVQLTQKSSQPLSLIFLDVDHFKNYNDKNGHPAGDRVLKQISSLMRSTFDSKDVVARYGGEEFVVLLKNTNHEEALMHAERFRANVEASEFEFGHLQPLGRVTVSIGVSSCPEHAKDSTHLIKAADDALYKAKKTSRNLVISANALIDSKQNVA